MIYNNSIDEQLDSARLTLSKALDEPPIAEALAAYGYDPSALAVGQTLAEQLAQAIEQRRMAYSQQYEATATLHTIWPQVERLYTNTRQIAQVAFAADGQAQTGLNLAGPQPRARARWLAHARHFYQNLLVQPTWLAGMAKYGYDQARLEAELAQVEQVYEAHTWQQTQMSEAQAATQVRNEQAERLATWMRDLAKVARVALQTQPALLIELGF